MIGKASMAVQVAFTVGVFAVAGKLYLGPRMHDVWQTKEMLFVLMLIVPIWWLLFEYSGLGQMSRYERYRQLFVTYLKVVVAGTLALYVVSWIADFRWLDARMLSLFGVLDLMTLFCIKLCFFRFMKFIRRRGYNTRQILIIGDDDSEGFIRQLLGNKDWGYRIWAIVSAGSRLREIFDADVKVYPGSMPIEELLGLVVIDELFYCKGHIDYVEVTQLVDLCASRGIVFRLKPVAPTAETMKVKFTYTNKTPMYVFRNVPDHYLMLKMKRAFDIVFSLVVVIVLSPFYLLIAMLIWFDDAGPVLFVQERVGLNGRRFNCLKFRTMVVNAEALKEGLMAQNEQSGPVFKMKYDPRVTRIGRVLRRTSLDELPQFFNVLWGDMSVVGPRPPVPSEVVQYESYQNRRLSMKPGITCIWQVSGRNNISFEDWVKLDMQYIDNWSFRLDLVIILKTIRVIINGNGQ